MGKLNVIYQSDMRNNNCLCRISPASLDQQHQDITNYFCHINNMSITSLNSELFIDENKLVYRAEGNANIVLEWLGSQKVLRIKKSIICRRSDKRNQSDESRQENRISDNKLELEKLKRSIDYIKIMSLFFSTEFIFQPELVFINFKKLSALNERLQRDRPADRLEKEIRCDYAIIIPDVAFLPKNFFRENQFMEKYSKDTYCIEIKPKQGWSFLDDDYLEKTVSQQLFGDTESSTYSHSVSKCRYCSMQYLKLQKKSIDKVSKYCPLELFSGKPIRMLSALKGLLGLPQNNLKIFKNGNLVYGDTIDKSILNKILKELFGSYKLKEERKTILINLLREILITDYKTKKNNIIEKKKIISIKKNKKKKNRNYLHFRNCDTNNQNYLPDNCALKQILNIQLLVKSYLKNIRMNNLNEIQGPYNYIDNILEQFETFQKYNTNLAESLEKSLLFEMFLANLKDQEKYLFGATALDLSIMITFCKISKAEIPGLSLNGQKHIICIGDDMHFLFNLTIMDLDPKSVNHHEKYIKQIKASHLAHKEFLMDLKE